MNTHELWLRALARSRGSRCIRSLSRLSDRGASAVEYGLMIAGIAALIVGVVFAFGGGTNGLFHGSCDTIWADTGSGDCE